jgi:hypothetical protein
LVGLGHDRTGESLACGLCRAVVCERAALMRASDFQFVAVAEAGLLEAQALLLCRSLRTFGGVLKDAPIALVSPRPSRRPSSRFRRALDALGAEFVAADLNSPCPEYGPSFRLAAMAHLARRPGPPVLVQLDSDSVFLGAPDFALDAADVLARPVDVKGVCTSADGDAREPYWRALCAACDVDFDALPWVASSVDGVRVKANYNAGLIVARREQGLFERTEEFFLRIVAAGLRTHVAPHAQRIGSGELSAAGFAYFGTVQIALALAASALKLRVDLLPPTYNVPLHYFEQLAPAAIAAPVHVHYHWLLLPECRANNPLLDGRMRLAPDVHAWLERNLRPSRRNVPGASLWALSSLRLRRLFAELRRAT